MSAVYLMHAAWRIALYMVYGAVALVVYRFVFSLSPPLPGYIALGIVGLAVVKDLFDHFAPKPLVAKVSYKFVDHNPFNIILLWGLFTGTFVIGHQTVFYAVVALAVLDMVVDGYVDYTHQPSTAVMGMVAVIVAAVIGGLSVFFGFDTVVTTAVQLWDTHVISRLQQFF